MSRSISISHTVDGTNHQAYYCIDKRRRRSENNSTTAPLHGLMLVSHCVPFPHGSGHFVRRSRQMQVTVAFVSSRKNDFCDNVVLQIKGLTVESVHYSAQAILHGAQTYQIMRLDSPDDFDANRINRQCIISSSSSSSRYSPSRHGRCIGAVPLLQVFASFRTKL